MLGAWVLHQLTQSNELEFFVCFSSVTALWGAQTLAHYVAANQFMDALAHHRRGLGLSALSVNWGPWADSNPILNELARYFTQIGMRNLPADDALAALGDLLELDVTQRAVVSVDWSVFSAVYQAKHARPLLARIQPIAPPAEPVITEDRRTGWLARLRGVPDDEQRNELLSFVQRELASVLGYPDSVSLDPRQGFFRLGMDSLQAVQLRNKLEASLGCSLPPTIAFEYPTSEALARYLADAVLKLPVVTRGKPISAQQAQQAEPVPARLDTLGEDSLAELLDHELAMIDDLLEEPK